MKTRTSKSAKARLFNKISVPPLRKGEIRKLEIIQAAIDCLAQHGLAGTNYETVGKSCQLKRPHVAYHFPEWSELLDSAIRYVYATGQGVVADYLHESKESGDALRAYIEGTFAWLESHPNHAASITLLWHLATFDPKFRALNQEIKARGAERLGAILHPTRKTLRKTPMWEMVLNLHALIVGRCVEYLTSGRGGNTHELTQAIYAAALYLKAEYKR